MVSISLTQRIMASDATNIEGVPAHVCRRPGMVCPGHIVLNPFCYFCFRKIKPTRFNALMYIANLANEIRNMPLRY